MNLSTVPPSSSVDEYIIEQMDQGRRTRRAWLGFMLLIFAGVGLFIALQ